MLTTSQVLDRAADKIARDGWCAYDGLLWTHDPKAQCAATAIAKVALAETGGDSGCHKAHDVLAIAICGTDRMSAIWEWNDTPGRTKAEVIAMLRACAVVERARETQSQPVTAEVAA